MTLKRFPVTVYRCGYGILLSSVAEFSYYIWAMAFLYSHLDINCTIWPFPQCSFSFFPSSYCTYYFCAGHRCASLSYGECVLVKHKMKTVKWKINWDWYFKISEPFLNESWNNLCQILERKLSSMVQVVKHLTCI